MGQISIALVEDEHVDAFAKALQRAGLDRILARYGGGRISLIHGRSVPPKRTGRNPWLPKTLSKREFARLRITESKPSKPRKPTRRR